MKATLVQRNVETPTSLIT